MKPLQIEFYSHYESNSLTDIFDRDFTIMILGMAFFSAHLLSLFYLDFYFPFLFGILFPFSIWTFIFPFLLKLLLYLLRNEVEQSLSLYYLVDCLFLL